MGFDEAGVRRRRQTVATVLAALVCALALPAGAAAVEFTVNSNGDEPDATLGDETCLTASGKCTLRAALQESNESEETDQIAFEEDPFDGNGAEATIALSGPLPTIVRPVQIQGNECPTEAGVPGPCIGIGGQPGESALKVEGAPETEIEWLSITGAKTGIEVKGSNRVKIFSSWIGVELDGSAGPNETGVFYGPGSDRGKVGAFVEGLGNLFANNTAVGLDLLGASEAEVQGNRFGVGVDGSTPAANGEDVEVTSDTSGGGDAAEGNEIGGRVQAGSVGGPCDRECNLISGAAGTGLDLQGEDAGEGPAVTTTVAGNYFGLTADGAGSAPNAGANIRVGAAGRTVIGGAREGDANRFSGGAVAVEAGPGAPGLVVRGNRIGVNGLGQTASPPSQGIDVDSNGLASAALEAILAGNELRMAGGTGILQDGFGAWIVGNEVSGAATGIRTVGASLQGNLIEGNSVSTAGLDAILLENELNDVVGNRVTGAGGAGIAVRGVPPFGVSGNVIGGDSAGEENEINGAAGPAIAVENTTSSITTVLRNRGLGSTGPFVDLLAASPSQTKGPNGGIAPPAILSATDAGAIGLGEPGATVRVFRKQTALAGEIAGYLGSAMVDGDGNWALGYAAPLPDGTAIAAAQTSKAGGSSELALGMTKAAGQSGDESGGTGGGGRIDKARPRSAILKGPQARSSRRTASFKFASDETGTRFQCRLDRKPFRSCSSPQRYGGLRPGRHVFAVRAIDRAGNVESTPAKRAFTVLVER